MAKKSIGDINGWVFISVGFIVMAISIFFYDQLKIFIALGGLMTLYGLGKLSYDNLKAKIFSKDVEENPIDLNKAQNPYMHQQIQHPQKRQSQQMQYPQQQAPIQQRIAHPQHNQNQGRYCHSCGAPKQAHHRFCAHCGTRFA